MTDSSTPAAEALAPVSRPGFLRDLMRRPAASVALVFLALLVVACVAAPLLAPFDPRAQDLGNVLAGPSGHHLLGTDTLGRDVLSRLLYGGRRSMLSIVEAIVSVLVLGVPSGVAAGYAGRWFDRTATRVAEAFMAVPAIILILVVLAAMPDNENAAMFTLGVLGAPGVFRVVRGATLQVRNDLYIAAARVSGVSHGRIVTRHVLPRIKGPIIVQATLFAIGALLFESGLGYLGLASDPLTPTWGGMVAEASTVITRSSWLLYPSGATIAVTILALGILGDAVRDSAAAPAGGELPASRRRRPLPAPAKAPDTLRQHTPAGTADAPEPLLDVAGLTVAVATPAGEVIAVGDVSLAIGVGETVGLLGESGCGKSLTALAILQLLPAAARLHSGTIRFDGHTVTGMSKRVLSALRGSGIAYVSQEPLSSLDPAYTVGAQLGEVVRIHDGGSRRSARARVLELLAQVRIPSPRDVIGAYPHELSGGMAQRVALAIALAGRPRLLIADEPTTALDVTVQSQILELLREIQQETRMSVLLVTHDWGVVADMCHRVVVMYAGQTVEQGAGQELFDTPLHPYTAGLLHSNPAFIAPGERLPSMPGRVPPPGEWPSGCHFAERCPRKAPECEAAPVPILAVAGGRQARCVQLDALQHEGAAAHDR
jgi:peptide/nickel transport system permease protein